MSAQTGMISYAQNYEDVMLERIFAHVQSGFYVDVGACHPVNDSVTQHFYLRGWSGINIEPQPSLYAELQRERPRDCNLNLCIGNQPGIQTLYITADIGTSTLDAALGDSYRKAGNVTQQIDVNVISLNDIWRQHVGERPVQFLKIDVEGFEKSVLASADFTRVTPAVLLIEAVHPQTRAPTHDEWEYLLLEHYEAFYFDGLNRFYRRRDYPLDLVRCSVPPNVFDHFTTHREHLAEQACLHLRAENQSYREQLPNLAHWLTQKDAALADAAQAYTTLRADDQACHEQLQEAAQLLAQKDAALANAAQAYQALHTENQACHEQLQGAARLLAEKDAALADAAAAYQALRAAFDARSSEMPENTNNKQ
jgi:FkbM family methyltransferase